MTLALWRDREGRFCSGGHCQCPGMSSGCLDSDSTQIPLNHRDAPTLAHPPPAPSMPAADRSATCTDVAPDSQFTCEEQANEYDKCNASFIYLYSYCLKSCKRCGEARGMIERMGWLVGGIPICRDFELRCIIQFSWQLTPLLTCRRLRRHAAPQRHLQRGCLQLRRRDGGALLPQDLPPVHDCHRMRRISTQPQRIVLNHVSRVFDCLGRPAREAVPRRVPRPPRPPDRPPCL